MYLPLTLGHSEYGLVHYSDFTFQFFYCGAQTECILRVESVANLEETDLPESGRGNPFIIIIKPDPLQSHNLLRLLVLGLEHGAICAWLIRKTKANAKTKKILI